jgi:hypothetical protein
MGKFRTIDVNMNETDLKKNINNNINLDND